MRQFFARGMPPMLVLLLLLLPLAHVAAPSDDLSPIDEMRSTLDALSALGDDDADGTVDEFDEGDGAPGDGVEGGLAEPAAAMRRTLDDVLALGVVDDDADEEALFDDDDEDADIDSDDLEAEGESSESRPLGTRPGRRRSADEQLEWDGDASLAAVSATPAATRRRMVLEPLPPDVEESELWRQASASFDDREYRHALPLWQELAAASSSAFEGSHGTRDAEGLRVQITAAFNLALTYEQLGA